MELTKIYPLTNEAIDEISMQVSSLLEEMKMERRSLLRLRLVIEELLLDWQAHFSPQAECTLRLGKRFGSPYIQLETGGESWNPLNKNADEYGSYRGRLLANMGLSPLYSYDRGKNRLTFRLKKPKANPLASLLIAVVAAVLAGLIGMLLPEGLRADVLSRFLTPIYDAFFNLLSTIAGPMVFLSVAWGIYGIGDASTFGRIGKRMIIHFVSSVFLACAATALLSLPLFSIKSTFTGGGASHLDSLFQMVLDFIPDNIITPFQEGNSMQIILTGAVFGLAMLMLGKQAEYIARSIEQINNILQLLMEFISKLVPGFIFIVLVQMIWAGTLDVVVSAWKPVLIFAAAALLIAAIITGIAAMRCNASPLLLMKKAFPAAIISLTTASSVASFGASTHACENKLGVDSHITNFGLPLGIVMFPLGTAMYFLLICMHTAEAYAISCSPVWFILAIFACSVLSIAAPPIPGGTLTCYTVIFTQLGLPAEALVVALALDVLCDFLATGVDIYCLQLDLVIQAKRMGRLNETLLRKQS